MIEARHILTSPRERLRLMQFGLVGGSGVIVNNGLLWLLAEHTRLPFYLCSFIAIECAIITNFLLNDAITWRDQRSGHRLARLLRYNISASVSSLFVNMVVLLLLKQWVGLPYLPANLAGIGCGMMVNFAGNSLWTYGSHRVRLPQVVVVVVLASLVARMLMACILTATPEEAYLYACSIHPSFYYLDTSPMVAFMAGLFPYLSGIAAAFTIRLAPMLMFTGATLLLYALTRHDRERDDAVATVLLVNATPLLLLGAGTVMPRDACLVFFWVLAVAYLKWLLAMHPTRVLHWAATGGFVGMVLLTSTTGGFLLLAAMSALMLLDRRDLLRTPAPYVCTLVAVSIWAPVPMWRLASPAVEAGAAAGSNLSVYANAVERVKSIGGYLLWLGPVAWAPLAVAVWRAVQAGFCGEERRMRFYFWFGLTPAILGLVLVAVGAKGFILSSAGFAVLMVPAGEALRTVLGGRNWVRGAVAACVAVLLVVIGWSFAGTRSIRLPRRTLGDLSLEAAGQDDVGEYLSSYFARTNRLLDSTQIVTPLWQIASYTTLATGGRARVRCTGQDCRDFAYWGTDSTADMDTVLLVWTDHFGFDRFPVCVVIADSTVDSFAAESHRAVHVQPCRLGPGTHKAD